MFKPISAPLIGSHFRAARWRRGFDQATSAAAIGISLSQLRHIEAGRSKPSLEALVRAVAVYATSADYLLGCNFGKGTHHEDRADSRSS